MTTKIIGTSRWGLEGSMQVKVKRVASAYSHEYCPKSPHHSPWVSVRGCLLADIKALRAVGYIREKPPVAYQHAWL